MKKGMLGLAAVALGWGVAFASVARAEEAADQNAGLEKFMELNRAYHEKLAVGDVADYVMASKSGDDVMTGAVRMEVTEKDGADVVFKVTTTVSVDGEEIKDESEGTGAELADPKGKYEFGRGDVTVDGKTYKDCDIVKITGAAPGPDGEEVGTCTVLYLTHENNLGLVKMVASLEDLAATVLERVVPSERSEAKK